MDERRARVIRDAAKVENIPVLVGNAEGGGAREKGPVARLVQNEDGKSQIELFCSCGRKIVIDCDYD